MAKNVVNWEKFDFANLVILPPQTGTDKGKFLFGQYGYRYTNTDGTNIEDLFRIQLGRLSSKYGFQLSTFQSDEQNGEKSEKYSIRFELVGREGVFVADFFNHLFNSGSQWVFENRSELGSFGRSITSIEVAKAMFTQPLSAKKAGSPPAKYFNVDTRAIGKLDMSRPTGRMIPSPMDPSVMMPEYVAVPYTALVGRAVDLINTVWCRRIYIKNKASIQCYLDRCILAGITEKPVSYVEDSTILEIQKANPEAFSAMNSFFNSLPQQTLAAPVSQPAETHTQSTEPYKPFDTTVSDETKSAFSGVSTTLSDFLQSTATTSEPSDASAPSSTVQTFRRRMVPS